jgi:hypothetical protein
MALSLQRLARLAPLAAVLVACSSPGAGEAPVTPASDAATSDAGGAAPSLDGGGHDGPVDAPAADAGEAAAPCIPGDGGVSDTTGPLVIDSLDCDVTAHEVDAFLSVVSEATIPTSQYPNGVHNFLADGAGGTTLEAVNRLYEITGDIPALAAQHAKLLDLAIAWSDAWLSHRNDLALGEKRVMWTGKVEPVWPPDAPPSTYAGCEVGETVGILAYTALDIVRTPAIANSTVPDGDPNGYGATYLARAKTYVAMLEQSMDAFFAPNFLDATTLTIHHPASAAYAALPKNNVNAWNREMMFLHAWQTLAQVHGVLGDDPTKQATYETIVRSTVDLFVKNAQPAKAPDGTAVYDWGYGNSGDQVGYLTGEQIDIHAEYDIWGLTRAYAAGLTSATAQEMALYAATVVHEIAISPGVYASYVDRCCSTATLNFLPEGFMLLVPFDASIYRPAATADIKSGRQKSSPALTVSILWAKHALAKGP